MYIVWDVRHGMQRRKDIVKRDRDGDGKSSDEIQV